METGTTLRNIISILLTQHGNILCYFVGQIAHSNKEQTSVCTVLISAEAKRNGIAKKLIF